MAYDYKSIGVSAAKVVSILAVAGLLWWQRPNDKYPRPQDEAELMTALIERTWAQGDTNYAFIITIPENTYLVAYTNGYSNLVINSTIHTNGSNVLRSANRKMEVIFPIDYAPALTYVDPGMWIGDIGGMTLFYQPEALYWSLAGLSEGDPVTYTWWYYEGVEWAPHPMPWQANPYAVDADGNPITIYAAYCGSAELSIKAGTREDHNMSSALYRTMTNAPAQITTNLIGRFPNAAKKYADDIRAAIIPRTGIAYHHYGDNNNPYYRYWLVPSNTYFETGEWNGTWDEMPTSDLNSDTQWWTQRVTGCVARWPESSNTVHQIPVWTNGVYGLTDPQWYLETTYTMTNNWYTTNYNSWLGLPIPRYYGYYYIQPRRFAFERDSSKNARTYDSYSKLYWSTNTYNDMGRCLSLMQWQLNINDKCTWEGSYNECYVWRDYVWIGDPPVQTVRTRIFGCDPTVQPRMPAVQEIWVGYCALMPAITFAHLTLQTTRLTMTNDTPFTMTNVTLWAYKNAGNDGYTMTYENPVPQAAQDFIRDNPTNTWPRWIKLLDHTNIPPWKSVQSTWLPKSPYDLSNYVETVGLPWVEDVWARNIAGEFGGWTVDWEPGYYDSTTTRRESTLPYFTLPMFEQWQLSSATYRSQFGALTNYFNHLPMR